MEPIGKVLKKTRLEKGFSLEDVQKKTKININILSAIEEENIINLSPIYVKGFLKIYSSFLGVNLEDYITSYKEQPSAAKAADLKETPAPFLEPSSNKFEFLNPDRKIGVSIIIGLVVVFLSIGLFSLGELFLFKGRSGLKKDNLAAVTPDKSKKKLQIAQLKKVAPAAVKSKQPAQAPQKYAASEIRLGILARENCWVTLKADGRLIFHGVLRKGKSESWQAKEKIELSLGNAGAVELVVNGERISSLGKRAQARKNILINREGLTVQ